jgi:protein O-GlcNAc transferase
MTGANGLFGPDQSLLDAATEAFRTGRLAESERVCREVLRSEPQNAAALWLLGATLCQAGNTPVGVMLLSRAAQLRPDDVQSGLSLGAMLLSLGRAIEAEGVFRRVLELDPELGLAHAFLGACLLASGRPAEASQSFERGLQGGTDFDAGTSSLLFTLQYFPGCDRSLIRRLAVSWGNRLAAACASERRPFPNDPEADRRLRIGYISADFRLHPAGQVMASILPAHDGSRVETFCYSNSEESDFITARLQSTADHWRGIVGLSDADVAETIRADGIDILMALTGHTSRGRLGVFARRPAPVQALWLGYWETTGLPTMDYFIADRSVCPPEDDRFYVEKVLRLPESFMCFVPSADAPVEPVPMLRRAYPTFGCFNTLTKVTPDVVRVWSRILTAVPTARLHVKGKGLELQGTRDRYARMFVEQGIVADRLTLSGGSSYSDYLREYGDVDVALDPFPYTGGATSVEALWMGVPFISLRGDRFLGRQGYSILSAAGLGDLVADSVEQYVDQAVKLVGQRDRLTELRFGLRSRMLRSNLCNAGSFTKNLEELYRQMWGEWCSQGGSTAPATSSGTVV